MFYLRFILFLREINNRLQNRLSDIDLINIDARTKRTTHNIYVQGARMANRMCSAVVSNTTGPRQSGDSTEAAMQVEYRTWTRDSHDLFDYESTQMVSGIHTVNGSCKIIRKTEEVSVSSADFNQQGEASELLLSIKSKMSKFYIFPADFNVTFPSGLSPRRMWLVTRFLEHGVYALKENDLLKLGRFKLKVKKIVANEDTHIHHTHNNLVYDLSSCLSNATEDKIHVIDETNESDSNRAQCRICLCEGGEPNNPILCACECKGSIMYIHLECLKHWMKGKMDVSDGREAKTCLSLKPVTCELCKTEFPTFVNFNDQKIPLLQLPNIEPPYVIFENACGGINKGYHVCSLASGKECRLGRGHDSDLRIADVSISRWHATVKHKDGKFLIEDHNSKFGTLIALRRPIELDSAHKLTVQVGRTVMNLNVNNSTAA